MATTPHEPSDGAVRARLLQAALTLFAARGYASTTVREIVAAAGVSKPVLYYYFGSKEGLYQALLEESFAGFEQMLHELLTADGSARERILRFCRTSLATAIENLEIVRLSHAIYYGPPQGAPPFDFDGFYQKMLDGISFILSDGMASGEFRPLPCHELTWGVMGIFNLCMQEQICKLAPRIDGAGMETALTILLDGIATGEKGQ